MSVNALRQRLSRSGRAQRLWRAARAGGAVRERLRFAARELRHKRQTRSYQLRESGLRTVVRHPLIDAWVLDEIFREHEYDPPPEASAALARAGHELRVVDLGGHVGLFGLWALGRWPVSRLVSYEPDPGNAQILERVISENGLSERWTAVRAAASTSDGTLELFSDYQISQMPVPGGPDPIETLRPHEEKFPFLRHSPLYEEPRTLEVESRDVLPKLRQADLVKIDIEGGEWPILADPRFAEISPRALVLEYHPELSSDPTPAATITRALRAAGLTPAHELQDPLPLGTVWAWRV